MICTSIMRMDGNTEFVNRSWSFLEGKSFQIVQDNLAGYLEGLYESKRGHTVTNLIYAPLVNGVYICLEVTLTVACVVEAVVKIPFNIIGALFFTIGLSTSEDYKMMNVIWLSAEGASDIIIQVALLAENLLIFPFLFGRMVWVLLTNGPCTSPHYVHQISEPKRSFQELGGLIHQVI